MKNRKNMLIACVMLAFVALWLGSQIFRPAGASLRLISAERNTNGQRSLILSFSNQTSAPLLFLANEHHEPYCLVMEFGPAGSGGNLAASNYNHAGLGKQLDSLSPNSRVVFTNVIPDRVSEALIAAYYRRVPSRLETWFRGLPSIRKIPVSYSKVELRAPL